MDSAKILEMRRAGYTWNEIDQMLLPPAQIKRNKAGGIVSKAYKFAKEKGLEGCFSKAVIGAYTATQIVIPLRKFNHFETPTTVPQQVEMFI